MWPCGLIEVPSLVRFVVLLLTPIDVLFDCLRTLAINSIYASEKRHCSLNMETPSPETPQQPTFTPERFLMAAIVAAVLAANLACGYLVGEFAPPIQLVVTTFTTMVLLGIVATARHPKSNATWMTTAVNGCVMLLFFASMLLCREMGSGAPMGFLLILYTIMLVVCAGLLTDGPARFRRSFHYYQISSFVNWITLDAMTWLVLSAGTV